MSGSVTGLVEGSPGRRRRVGSGRIGLALAALAVGLASCTAGAASSGSLLEKKQIVIGTSYDQPGIGQKTASGVEGLDIDVARYVTRKLGYADSDVTFIRAGSDNREKLLLEGKADLIVAFYSIRPDRAVQVDFAGPYYVAHQDIVVPESNKAVRGVRDLQGLKMCDTEGSGSWERITQERRVQPVHVTRNGWADCIKLLESGGVEAISTEDAILAGYLGSGQSGLKFVNAPFTDERIGIGLRKNDNDACEAINRAISEMYQDGTAGKLLEKWFGRTGLHLATDVPQFEGCT